MHNYGKQNEVYIDYMMYKYLYIQVYYAIPMREKRYKR